MASAAVAEGRPGGGANSRGMVLRIEAPEDAEEKVAEEEGAVEGEKRAASELRGGRRLRVVSASGAYSGVLLVGLYFALVILTS